MFQIMQMSLDRLHITSTAIDYVKSVDISSVRKEFVRILNDASAISCQDVQLEIKSLTGVILNRTMQFFLSIASTNMGEAYKCHSEGIRPRLRKV